MRRYFSGATAALVIPVLSAATVPAAAMASNPAAPPGTWAVPGWSGLRFGPEGEGEEEDDLVIIDEGEDEPVSDDPGDVSTDLDLDLGNDAPDEPVGQIESEELGDEEDQTKTEMGLITVVQRQRMLKKKRFELSPQFGITVNDPYVRHYAIGLDFNYWLTNRMALGLTGTGLLGTKTPRYDNIRFQQGLLLTANRTLWRGSLNFTYNPFYGKIAVFNRALLHWEGSVVAGVGALQTQVIPRYEALHEPFSTVTGGGHFGLQGRFYVPKVDWMSFNFGVRTWIFADKLEPINRGPDVVAMGTGDNPALDDPQAAKDAADFEIAYQVSFFLGVSFFLPTSFKYTTER